MRSNNFMLLRGYLSDKSPGFQFSVLVLLWFFCYSLVNVLLAGALLAYYGAEQYEALAESLARGTLHTNLVKTMQIAMSVGAFLLPPLILGYLKNENMLAVTGLLSAPRFGLLLLLIPIMVSAAPFIMAMLELNQQMKLPAALSWLEQYLRYNEQRQEEILKQLLHMQSHFDFALNLLMIALVPAVCEEFFFRGCLQPVLAAMYRNVHLAVIISAVIFSLIHFQFYGFLPRMILGIILGYLFAWSNNLWYSVAAHLLNNGAQVVLLYLYQLRKISFDMAQAEAPGMGYVILATILMFWSLSVFREKSGSDI